MNGHCPSDSMTIFLCRGLYGPDTPWGTREDRCIIWLWESNGVGRVPKWAVLWLQFSQNTTVYYMLWHAMLCTITLEMSQILGFLGKENPLRKPLERCWVQQNSYRHSRRRCAVSRKGNMWQTSFRRLQSWASRHGSCKLRIRRRNKKATAWIGQTSLFIHTLSSTIPHFKISVHLSNLRRKEETVHPRIQSLYFRPHQVHAHRIS